jgi:hypothetical protein
MTVEGVYKATVASVSDPQNRGRVTLNIPKLFPGSTSATGWAEPLVPYTENPYVPTVGTPVWCIFQGGDIDYPCYFTSVTNTNLILPNFSSAPSPSLGEIYYNTVAQTFSVWNGTWLTSPKAGITTATTNSSGILQVTFATPFPTDTSYTVTVSNGGTTLYILGVVNASIALTGFEVLVHLATTGGVANTVSVTCNWSANATTN